jgi:hypothetical protein
MSFGVASQDSRNVLDVRKGSRRIIAMARPLRVAIPGASYYVTSRGGGIFRDGAYYQRFEELSAALPSVLG